MADRMDQLIALAVRQGFAVWQRRDGKWVFAKDTLVAVFKPPRSVRDWNFMISTLRGAGLRMPGEDG